MWGWLALLIGIAYGYFTPGQQNKMDLLKKGLLLGIVIAIVLVVLAALLNMNPFGFGTGLIANIIGAIIITLLFVGGVWLGDLLEHRFKKN